MAQRISVVFHVLLSEFYSEEVPWTCGWKSLDVRILIVALNFEALRRGFVEPEVQLLRSVKVKWCSRCKSNCVTSTGATMKHCMKTFFQITICLLNCTFYDAKNWHKKYSEKANQIHFDLKMIIRFIVKIKDIQLTSLATLLA